MKQTDFTVGIAAFLLIFSGVIHLVKAQPTSLKQSEIFTDKYSVRYRVSQLDSQIQEILWCGTSQAKSEDGDIISYEETTKVRKLYILTVKGSLYYSSDYGFTIKRVTDEIPKSANVSSENISFTDIMISPVNNKKVFFFSKTGDSFYTDSCGTSYKAIKHDPFLRNIQPNPSNSKMLIGLIPIECKDSDPECSSSTSDLMLTQDSGVTWKKILSQVEQAQWDKTKQVLANSQNRIILIHYDIVKDDKGVDKTKRKISYTDNLGLTYVLIEKKGIRFYQTEDYIFILTQKKEYNEYKLIIGSAYVNQSTSRSEIDLPLKRVKDESFTVLDIDGGQIMVAINHQGDDAGYTNVYISNADGKQFSLSLQYNVGDSDSNIDFEPVNSNEGTYISNTYSSSTIKKYQQILEKKESQKRSGTSRVSVDSFTLNNFKKTKISFNKGGEWHSIKAPEVNYFGNPIQCSGECSLNFKGRTDSQGTPVYSTENAPGVILATGNVGPYLTNKMDDLRTYLSTDGGHNWKEIQQGSHEYEIADQGSIIAMARDDKPTEEIIYTIDEGEKWRKLNFKTENKFTVDAFITEVSNEERTFLFYGRQASTSSGFIGAVDFSKLFKRECKGFETPGEPDSDYERWVPINFSGKKCLFGSRVSYIRKKTDSECFNSKKISESRMIQGSCECTEEDFECDYGYIKDQIDSNKCLPINSKFAQQKKDAVPLNCKDYYYVTQGYRKLSNNLCQGGIEEMYAPQKIRCPSKEEPVNSDKKPVPSKDGLFNRTPEEIKKEIEKQYKAIDLEEQKSGYSFLNILILFVVLFILYTYREEVISRLKGIQSSLKASKLKNDNDNYGYKNQQNNAEQFSLFHNDNDDEFDAEQL